MSAEVTRNLDVTFRGMSTLKSLISELQRVAQYFPDWQPLQELHDNGSANPELRELTFTFRRDAQ